jgi:DNA-binding Lrp family transcriptional regulator
MDEVDKKLLNAIQGTLPVVAEPYREVGERLGLSEDEVITRLSKLKEEGIIRRIGPTFETRRLGYSSTLVAMRVPEERLDEVGEHIAKYDEVTHNYSRSHYYNLWFTLTTESPKHLDALLERVKEETGTNEVFNLPCLHLFKINAKFTV